ncbi:helix-turn-helix domain-containing protein [Neptuniibacter sp. QD48_55]|uniref:helix-turn-helix domain-containing protein n=1 Tax=Neptuniibacter sp. QD48_55 TaxID=3398212 RepID=UPI0039F58D53
MGYKVVDLIINHIHLPKPSQKLTLIVIGKFANEKSFDCWPSNKTIAKLSGLTVRTVQRSIKELIDLGYITVIDKGGGRKKTNYLKLNLNTENSENRVSESHPFTNPKVIIEEQYPDNSEKKYDIKTKNMSCRLKKGDKRPPESIKETIKESINEVRGEDKLIEQLPITIPKAKAPPPEQWTTLLEDMLS